MPKSTECYALDCDNALTGEQVKYCSHRCKQKVKNDRRQGRQCMYCGRAMKPVPVMGGFKQHCHRKACERSAS